MGSSRGASCLSHRAAGDLHGLRRSTKLEVTVPRGRAVPPDLYALDRAERLQVLDLDAVQGALSRARGRRGARALRKAIAGSPPADTRSVLEDRHSN